MITALLRVFLQVHKVFYLPQYYSSHALLSFFIMSSPTSSDDFLMVGLTPRPSAVSPTAGGSPGESDMSFSFSGGGAKRTLLFVPAGCTERYCLGLVGGNKKFCLKLIEGEGKGCGIGKHETPKFDLGSEVFYIRAAENQAFCHPVLSRATLSERDFEDCQVTKKSASEWEAFFSSLSDSKVVEEQAGTPELFIDTATPTAKAETSLESPNFADRTMFGLFPTLPVMTFDLSKWDLLATYYVCGQIRR